MNKSFSRRAVIAAAAAFAALPAMAAAKAPSAETSIARLWTEAERLSGALAVHADAVAAAETLHGSALAGWMYLPGEPNAIGNRRYDTLVEILRSTPRSVEDIAIMRRAARDADIARGPRSWAETRVAEARIAA